MDKKYNSRSNWWYDGAVCEYDGCDHSLDLPEHHEYPNHNNSCRVKWCKEHYYFLVKQRTDSRRIHPDTSQPRNDWIRAKAQVHYKARYGSLCKDRKADPKWRGCHDMAKADAEAIDWVYPNNVVQIPQRKESRLQRMAKRIAGDGVVTPAHIDKAKDLMAKGATAETAKQNTDPSGFVYAVSNPAFPGYVKVGKAQDPDKRIDGYQTGDPHRAYKIDHCEYFDDRHTAETAFQDMLKDDGFQGDAQGEWFQMSVEDAVRLLDAFSKDSKRDTAISQG